MHPLHDYIAHQVAERLKSRRIVVMYDPRRELVAFFNEACAGIDGENLLREGAFEGRSAKVFSFQGSFLQVRAAVEPLTSGDGVGDVIAYLPGVKRDEKSYLLLELEKAGTPYTPAALQQMARLVLKKRFTDVALDEMLNAGLNYQDLARMCAGTGAADSASLLKGVFGDSDTRIIIASWIAEESRDADIEKKGATSELRKALQARIGLEIPSDASLSKMRAITIRYVLGNEFRLRLEGEAPKSLASIPTAKLKDHIAAIEYIASRLRESRTAATYETLADRVAEEFGLDADSAPGEKLTAIDTFRFEERAILQACFKLIAKGRFADANTLIEGRTHSFWLDRDPIRRTVWEACRLMIEMGVLAGKTMEIIAKTNGKSEDWVSRYTDSGPEGWFRLDGAQRRWEALVSAIDEADLDEEAVARTRAVYDEAARRMAEGFIKVFEKADWTVPGYLPQSRIWAEIVANQPKPVAVVVVDAMRYEIGVELAERLKKAGEVKLSSAIASLPSITPVGMAALLPGAAASFSVIEKNGKLGAQIGDAFLPDLSSRQKYLGALIPGSIEVTLNDVISWKESTRKKLAGAQVVLVRSSEIDSAGENTENRYARSIMGGIVDDVARCLQKLASAGIVNAVITADHGHLFFGSEREESMRISNPGGTTVDLHRRCWIGRGGSTPPGTVRISGPRLGYATDLEVVVPASVSVFKSGGDLAYHHGGASLQELVIPVLTVRSKPAAGGVDKKSFTVSYATDAITNRIFSIEIVFGGATGTLFEDAPRKIRPQAVSGDRQVASAKMTANGPIEGGEVTVERGKPVTVVFLLADDSATSLRFQILDAETDAVLVKSPKDIPVRLGV